MVKRTSVNLDMALVSEASDVLGTARTTDTLHEALREIVRRQRLQRLARRDFPDLTLEAIEEMRKSRTFDWS